MFDTKYAFAPTVPLPGFLRYGLSKPLCKALRRMLRGHISKTHQNSPSPFEAIRQSLKA
ncbi:hypothetical protein [Dryocola boscaweniae]|uniref:hypothetical protein n=1 Tax=Dryocola boscaweniae TaxID=2925397 RepID=UPI0038CDB05D